MTSKSPTSKCNVFLEIIHDFLQSFKNISGRNQSQCFNKLLKAPRCPLHTGVCNRIHKGSVLLQVSLPAKFLISLNPDLWMKLLVVASGCLEFCFATKIQYLDNCCSGISFDPILLSVCSKTITLMSGNSYIQLCWHCDMNLFLYLFVLTCSRFSQVDRRSPKSRAE